MAIVMKERGCMFSTIGWWLVVVGAINWGLVGVGGFMGRGNDFNVVHLLLGSISWLENLVYIVVAVAAIMLTVGCKCAKCKADMPA